MLADVVFSFAGNNSSVGVESRQENVENLIDVFHTFDSGYDVDHLVNVCLLPSQ